MKVLTSLALLTALSVAVDGGSPSKGQVRSPAQVEAARRRGGVSLGPRGRRKTIWSYNPGHRSLAFLVAGGVYTVSPPPLESGTAEFRCLGCCGDKATILGKGTAAPKISNRVSEELRPPEEFMDLGTEPNSVNDRCLGCCEESVTPSLRMTPGLRETPSLRETPGLKETPSLRETPGLKETPDLRKTPGLRVTPAERGTPSTAGKQQGRGYEPPCTLPQCNPDWRHESSSSSEEVPVMRRHRPAGRLQPIQLGARNLCRHLGCRSALGLGALPGGSSSSSSEED